MLPHSTILGRRRLVAPLMKTINSVNGITLFDQSWCCGAAAAAAAESLLSGNKITSSGTRWYVSRAHPRPIPEFPVPQALQMVLEGIEQRKLQRVQRWERSQPRRQAKGIQVRNRNWRP
jgi:hypothetical protein